MSLGASSFCCANRREKRLPGGSLLGRRLLEGASSAVVVHRSPIHAWPDVLSSMTQLLVETTSVVGGSMQPGLTFSRSCIPTTDHARTVLTST